MPQDKHFVHLHTHSTHSFLDGMNRIDDLFFHVKSLNQRAVAITDHGNMSAVIKAYKESKVHDIKYIVGMEAYVTEKYGQLDKNGKPERKHMILLVQNEKGYRNFLRLQYESYKPEHLIRGKPTLDYEVLSKYSEGLIATSACVIGVVAKHLFIDNDPNEALRQAKLLANIYNGKFYIELQGTSWDIQKEINKQLIEIARLAKIPVICSVDAHYTWQHSCENHDMLLAIQSKTTKNDPTRKLKFPCNEYYIKSEEEILKCFDDPKIIYRTGEIADMCESPTWLDYKGQYRIPKFPIEQEKDYIEFLEWQDKYRDIYGHLDFVDAYLYFKSIRQFHSKLSHKVNDSEYQNRLQEELGVIIKKGLSSYMLIVADYIRAARENGVLVGPGRGSAAGSLVSFLLGITQIDPIPFGLLFSRFINEQRNELADIDSDFSDQAAVRKYLKQKYGEDRIAGIANYNTMATKLVLKDVARSMQIGIDKSDSFNIANAITKSIPDKYVDEDGENKPIKSLKQALEHSPELSKELAKYPGLVEYAKSLEGLYRQPGVHAAGVLIAPEPLPDILPLWRSKNEWVCQLDGKALESMGYLKADILKLDMLNVVQDTINNIPKLTGKDFTGFQYDDQNVYKTIADGHLLGMFQLEKSDSMREVAMSIKPVNIEEISLIIALNRPGPMKAGMHTAYPERKFGRQPAIPPHPTMEPALKETLGILVYEEQVQRIARDLAGFSLGEGDNIRKICKLKGKGDGPRLLAEIKEKFMQGCKRVHNMSDPESLAVFQLIENFSEYGFNKSHSVAYSMLAYQTAYLKYYYPAIFLASCLNYASDTEWGTKYRKECGRLGINILLPDINQSDLGYTVVSPSEIRIGLSSISGLSFKKDDDGNLSGSAASIKNAQPYASIEDFVVKLTGKRVTTATVASLNHAGALDSFNISRLAIDKCYADLRKKVQTYHMRREGGIGNYRYDFYQGLKDKEYTINYLHPLPEYSKIEKLKLEAEALGSYVSGNLASIYPDFFTHQRDNRVILFNNIDKVPANAPIRLEVLIKQIARTAAIKSGRNIGKKYMVVRLEDVNGDEREAFVWPESLEKFEKYIKEFSLIKAVARTSNKNGFASISIDSIIIKDIKELSSL